MRYASRLPILLLVFGAFGGGSALRAVDSGSCVAGSISAPLKIEVFSDYQCPACKQFYLMTMRTIIPEYADSGKACVVYREFPLTVHNHSRDAARYGYAAMRVGTRQWAQVTDALFMNQDSWAASGDIESFVAKALGKADLDALHKEMQNTAAINAAIESDIRLGTQRGVNSTPTFFITPAGGSTQKIAQVVQYQILKRYLDNLLTQAK
jgi:protein-disulfide isomerase